MDEEKYKAKYFKGPNVKRSSKTFKEAKIDRRLYKKLVKDVFQPSKKEINDLTKEVKKYCKSGKVKVLIPLRELQDKAAPIIAGVLDGFLDYVNPENIFIAETGLHPDVKKEIISRRITMISKSTMKKYIDWKTFLGVLRVDNIDRGQGFGDFLGTLYLYINKIMNEDDWLVMSDGDIANFKEFKYLPYILYPIVKYGENWNYLKIAKVGWNNEAIKGALNALLPYFKHQIKGSMKSKIAKEIYDACIHHVWMIGGQYAMKWKLAFNRMYITGNSDGTMPTIQYGWKNFAQVINPIPSLDSPNTWQKENSILVRIIHTIHALAVYGKSVRKSWDLKSVKEFNKDVLSLLKSVVYISDKNEPVCLDSFQPERVIPSIPILLKNKVIRERRGL